MRLAALLLGILGGLSGLTLAVYGHVAVAVMGGLGGMPAGQQDAAKLLLYGLPIASFIGAGLAFSKAGLSALLLLGSAAGWFAIGAKFGYGFNVVTATAMILDGLAGLLALGGIGNQPRPRTRDSGEVFISKEERNRNSYVEEFRFIDPPQTTHDTRKWDALLMYDEDLARVYDKLSVLGKKWQDKFVSEYLAINDKTYLPQIVKKIIADAKAEHEAKQEAPVLTIESRPIPAPLGNNRRIGAALLILLAIAGIGIYAVNSSRKSPQPQSVAVSTQPTYDFFMPVSTSVISQRPDFAYEIPVKYPKQLEALHRILPSGFQSVEWVYNLKGVAGPITETLIGGQKYLGGRVCKIHDCGDNMFTFLVAEDGSRAIATVRSSTIPGAENVNFGAPRSAEMTLLGQIEKM